MPRLLPRIGSTGRALVAVALVSSWLVLLLTGAARDGAVPLIHLLLAAALVLFPWRAAAAPPPQGPEGPPSP